MIPLRSIPTLIIALAALAAATWFAVLSSQQGGLYGAQPYASAHGRPHAHAGTY